MDKYLDECLTSLVKQTFRDFEIIVINDGSKDNSQIIIDKYKKKYSKLIRSFSYPNQGISVTRNIGIEKARGEYITFIDSDDYVSEAFLEKMYNCLLDNDADMVVCDYYKVFDDHIEEFKVADFEPSNTRDNPGLIFKINTSPWNKLYKKSLFNEEKFEKIKYEDLLLIPKIVCSCKKIVKLGECLNYYRIRGCSETTIVDERVFDILKILEKLDIYFEKNNYLDKAYQEIEYFNIYRIVMYIIQQRYQKNKEIANKYIRDSYKFMEERFPDWRKNKYYREKSLLKRMIETNEFLAKIYVKMWR